MLTYEQSAAIATFNVMVAEGRRVACGLLCQTHMTRDEASAFTDEQAVLSQKALIQTDLPLENQISEDNKNLLT